MVFQIRAQKIQLQKITFFYEINFTFMKNFQDKKRLPLWILYLISNIQACRIIYFVDALKKIEWHQMDKQLTKKTESLLFLTGSGIVSPVTDELGICILLSIISIWFLRRFKFYEITRKCIKILKITKSWFNPFRHIVPSADI